MAAAVMIIAVVCGAAVYMYYEQDDDTRSEYAVSLNESDIVQEGYVVLEADLSSSQTEEMKNIEGMYYIVYVYGSSGNKVDCIVGPVPDIASNGTASWFVYVQDLEGLTSVSIMITLGPEDTTPIDDDAISTWTKDQT